MNADEKIIGNLYSEPSLMDEKTLWKKSEPSYWPALAALATTCNPAHGATTSELLQQGLYAEEVEGKLIRAIKTYDQVIKNGSAPPNQVAQALYREGMCYLEAQRRASARMVLEKLVAGYPAQTEIVEKARPILDELTDFDPAKLMRPGIGVCGVRQPWPAD